jgi:3-phosphoshikimate 1-carboxyvinyltransferase
MDHIISSSNGFNGKITVGGDKSISHRALLLGAISEGITQIKGLSTNADVRSTQQCLSQLGVKIEHENDIMRVHGVGLTGFTPPSSPLYVGNSGTTIRLLSGILVGQKFPTIITGDESIQKRPMGRIIKPLEQMGAIIKSTNNGYAPLTINGGSINAIDYHSPVASAQIKSCILLAGLYANGTTSVTEPHQSRDHTEKIFPDFGIPIYKNGLKVSVTGIVQPSSTVIEVPGDISSAAFFMIAAALVPNSNITIEKVGLNPTRIGIIKVLQQMGASLTIDYQQTTQNESIGAISVRSSKLKGIKIDSTIIPQLIDELPIIAIAAVLAEGRTIISGAGELRVKESDRIKSIVRNLNSMGIVVEEKEDGIIIDGPQKFIGANINSFGDHRIAMAFSIAGLTAEGDTTIKNADCVSVSMPNFFNILLKFLK